MKLFIAKKLEKKIHEFRYESWCSLVKSLNNHQNPIQKLIPERKTFSFIIVKTAFESPSD